MAKTSVASKTPPPRIKPPAAISTGNKPAPKPIPQGPPPKGSVHQIVDGLLSLAVPLASIKPDPANERTHARANLEAVKGSLLKFGQREPLVVNVRTGKIEAGHGRYTVMTELGWTHAAVILVDDDTKAAAGFRIAANRTAELADWDEAKLVETLRSFDADNRVASGFTDDEIARIEKLLLPPGERTVSFVAGASGYKSQFGVIVMCDDELHQKKVYDKLTADGYSAKVVTT